MKNFLHRFAVAITRGLAVIVAVMLVCGFFGESVPFFDSLSHFRAHLTIVLFVAALVLIGLRSIISAILAAGIAAYAAVSVSAFVVPRPGAAKTALSQAKAPTSNQGSLKLLQMNLRFNADTEPAIATIARLDPDVVTLQEMNRDWVEAIEPLRAAYPYTAFCGVGDDVGGVAILSQFPFIAEGSICRAADGFVARRLDVGQGRSLTVGSEHLEWPWPYRQRSQIARLQPILPDLAAPVVVAGDFNAAPWSGTLRLFAEASGTRLVEGIGPTWLSNRLPRMLRPLVGLPIDNILVSTGVDVVSVTREPATASDHLPVMLRFDLRSSPPARSSPRVVDRAAGQ